MNRTEPFGISSKTVSLSIVIPCYNEENTLRDCVDRVLAIKDDQLALEIIIVDDASTDGSVSVAEALEKEFPEIRLARHEKNQGKGAALRTGFHLVSGDFVAVQDADLEYDPMDLKQLIVPLKEGRADVVLGSRFLSTNPRRVLYFWHYMGNRFLTFLSNMFTDLNLSDMETCYKVFRREVLQGIEIEENRFGFEPEIVAKMAHKRIRIYEMGISYDGRTYEEGKKIGVRDGFRALYCIFRYNAPKAPLPVQFLAYLAIGGLAALLNLFVFLILFHGGTGIGFAAPVSFFLAAIFNYILCVFIFFPHRAPWKTGGALAMFFLAVGVICLCDLLVTEFLFSLGFWPSIAKLSASAMVLVLNFSARRYLLFPERASGPWKSGGSTR